ncbi:hypothetical protein TNCV_2627771 [Trichonephila clavipes]|uniref:Mos1 transposase HTH domain-containing protein n=1 Tax=Trichonephila clavipes TaxID=2585209 RepID=A0A8X6W7U9_TRICX|nr:hypothetical protein TNCV_2627771 [Trichonephila clavipes]
MQAQYDGNCSSQTKIYEWIERFNQGRTSCDDKGSGSPPTSTTENHRPGTCPTNAINLGRYAKNWVVTNWAASRSLGVPLDTAQKNAEVHRTEDDGFAARDGSRRNQLDVVAGLALSLSLSGPVFPSLRVHSQTKSRDFHEVKKNPQRPCRMIMRHVKDI